MKIIHAPDYDNLSQRAANLIAAQLWYKPNSLLGLATGSTPIGAYQYLVRRYCQGDLDFSAARSVNLDEYCGLDPAHPQSYHHFMDEHLFSKVNFSASWLPDGAAPDLEAEAARYEALLNEQGPVDLQVLGIGHNGHIGFNEPDDCFIAHTHVVALKEQTIQANARFFEDPDQVPRKAITMGVAAILQAKKVLLLAGEGKEEILHRALIGPITPRLPASILQLHPDLTVITTAPKR